MLHYVMPKRSYHNRLITQWQWRHSNRCCVHLPLIYKNLNNGRVESPSFIFSQWLLKVDELQEVSPKSSVEWIPEYPVGVLEVGVAPEVHVLIRREIHSSMIKLKSQKKDSTTSNIKAQTSSHSIPTVLKLETVNSITLIMKLSWQQQHILK